MKKKKNFGLLQLFELGKGEGTSSPGKKKKGLLP